MTLRQLRAEYQSVGIGPGIWGLVLEITGMIARRYPPNVYNYGESWSDDNLQDLAQQVVLDRLLSEGQLDYLFDQATSVESWRRLLTLQVRRTLGHRRRKTVVDRLLTRVRSLAEAPPFRIETVGRAVWISLRDLDPAWADLPDAKISQLAGSLRDIPQLAASLRSSRSSMIYTTPDLQMLLERVLDEVGTVSERDLGRLFEILLTSWLPTFLQQPEEDYPSEEPIPEAVLEDAEMRSAIENFVNGLSDAERWILVCKSQNIADAEVSSRLGRSRPWVAQRKHSVIERLGLLMVQFDADHHVPAMASLLSLISDGDSMEEDAEG